MMPFFTRIKAYQVAENEGWSHHEGEEFVYVLNGTIELHTEDYQPTVLSAGDCFYLDNRMRHRVINLRATNSHVLWSTTRPDFPDQITLTPPHPTALKRQSLH